jgi:hypothetical protein
MFPEFLRPPSYVTLQFPREIANLSRASGHNIVTPTIDSRYRHGPIFCDTPHDAAAAVRGATGSLPPVLRVPAGTWVNDSPGCHRRLAASAYVPAATPADLGASESVARRRVGIDSASARSVGTSDSSPAIYRWVPSPVPKCSPVGTAETLDLKDLRLLLFSRPYGTHQRVSTPATQQ